MQHNTTFFYKSPLGALCELFWGTQSWADTVLNATFTFTFKCFI